MDSEDATLQRFGSESMLELAAEPNLEAKRMPPSCPIPSFITQLIAAAIGAVAEEPTPTARRRV